MWLKTTLLLPVWLRDAKRLDTPARFSSQPIKPFYDPDKRLKMYSLENVKQKISRLGDTVNSTGGDTILKMKKLSKHTE